MPAKIPFRIFIVDDEIDLLMVLERFLKRQGYEVETAVNLTEAEERRRIFQPHLYLLDINIAGEDGRKLCWTIKAQEANPDVRVILISGYDCHQGRAALFGADEVLAKPMQPEYLLLRMAYHLKNVRACNVRNEF